MAAEGTPIDAGEVIVTTGGQQVIDLVTKTLIDPGDVIVAEGPTYPGAVPTFSSYQAEVVQIDMDADGMRVDLLEEALERLAREGRRPKFIYTVPSFQNPAGVTMSLRRARHGQHLCAALGRGRLLFAPGRRLPRQRPVEGHLLGYHLTDPAYALADPVLVRP